MGTDMKTLAGEDRLGEFKEKIEQLYGSQVNECNTLVGIQYNVILEKE